PDRETPPRGPAPLRPPPAPPEPWAPRRSSVSRSVPVPTPPDLKLHVLRDVPLGHVFPYLNLQMLLGKHLGVKGSVARLLEQGDAKVAEMNEAVEALERMAIEQRILRADGLYRFYEAAAEGDDLVMLDGGREVTRFRFPR